MRVKVMRRANCGNYFKTSKWTSDAKPTKKTWTGTDTKGRAVRKKLFECRVNYPCANKTTFIVKMDMDHNFGDASYFMPLESFVAEFAA